MESSRDSVGVTVAWSTSPQAMATDRWERTSPAEPAADSVVMEVILPRAGLLQRVARTESRRVCCRPDPCREGGCARPPAGARWTICSSHFVDLKAVSSGTSFVGPQGRPPCACDGPPFPRPSETTSQRKTIAAGGMAMMRHLAELHSPRLLRSAHVDRGTSFVPTPIRLDTQDAQPTTQSRLLDKLD